jgi:Tfp pilus assembly protein PilN
MKKELGLNLLPSSAKFQADRVRWKKRIGRVSLVMAVVYCLVGAILIGWLMMVMKVNKDVTRELKTWESRLATLSTKANTSQQIKYQAKIVAGVMANRFEYSRYLLLMRQIMPSEVLVNKLELVGRSAIKIDGVARDKAGMVAFEKRIDEINRGKLEGFGQAKLTGLGYGEGKWSFGLEVLIKNEK